MKKIGVRVTAVLTLICLLLASGCQGRSVKTETAEEFWARPHNWQCDKHMHRSGSSSDDGFYYVDLNDSWIFKYVDYTTRQFVALCNKVGCKHDDFTCEAFAGSGSLDCFFKDEKMYLIKNEDDGTHIYRCDVDASNREDKIMLTKDEMEKGNAVQIDEFVVNGDDFYYQVVYREPDDEATGEKKFPINAIRHVDMKNWTDEEICRSVEYEYQLIGADENGVLLCKTPDADVFTKVDLDSMTDEERAEGVLLLSVDELKELPLEAIYCNKKTGDMLTVYQGNARDTVNFPMADGSFLYRLARTDDAVGFALEKINMQTGEAEWVWKEKNGKGSALCNCVAYDGCLWVSSMTADEKTKYEMYIPDGFKEVALPQLKDNDSVYFACEHGLVVDRTEKVAGESGEREVLNELFIFTDKADKEKPEYILLSTCEI